MLAVKTNAIRRLSNYEFFHSSNIDVMLIGPGKQ